MARLAYSQAFVTFHAHYPGLYYAPGLWATADGVVPWYAFWMLVDAAAGREAFLQLQAFGAVALAIGATMGGDDGQRAARAALDELKSEAFPTES